MGQRPALAATSHCAIGYVMQNTEEIWQLVDVRKDGFETMSDRIWGTP